MMSKWISADSIINKLNSHVGFTTCADVKRAIKLIENAPSIDIVRCKECRFGQWHEQAEGYICIAHDQDLFDGDHFCSYGEREDE